MKKILHFHPNAFYARIFVKPLNYIETESGYSSKLVAATTNGPSDHFLKFSLNVNPLILIIRFFKLLVFLKGNKPDIIVIHNSTSALLPLLASRLLFVKNIIYFNHGLPFLGYMGLLRFLLKILEKLNCIFADIIITVSDDLKKNFSKITRKKINKIYYGSASGLDLKTKTLNTDLMKKIKKRINFNTNDKIILFVGRPNKRKGFHDILEIWNSEFKNEKNFKLILLGIYKEDITIKTKNIPKNIFPMGLVDETSPFFEIADYLFMTSHHEGLSYTILEAFQHRTIVISNKIDGVSELVKHKFNGFLVEKNNKYDYFNFLNDCEKNKKLKENFLNRSLKIIYKYDREKFLQSYIEFLKNFN